jgi:hypothetical protein
VDFKWSDNTWRYSENGEYCVDVTKGNCVGKDCYRVTNANSISNGNMLTQMISVHPNPVDDVIHINSPVDVHASIKSIDGRIILSMEYAGTISIPHLAQGVYFLHVTDKEGQLLKVVKIVKK